MNKYWVRIIINFVLLLFIMGAALLMQGCSTGGGDDASCRDIAYEYGYDVVGETGLMLVATTPEVAFISFEEMEAEYIDVEACAANTGTPGPTVFFTSFNHLGVGLELAFYSYASQSVYIDTDDEEWLPVRNCISDREFLRHEFMHHILYMNGEDPGHSNPKFDTCNARGPKSCNGEYCE